ncbi:MAG TPA: peptidoglycan DD-metalloendopeptidase family protein [Polyangia bacterium]|nr:peptidoglycan DD-metalloendopeptidase family protein [Polyangia bacterium]
MARRQRRRRRGGEVGKPLRLGVLLVGLVGINVYVFFFNRGTAPREILNMQSTSKSFESTRQEALSADVRRAGELLASSSGDARKSAPKLGAPAPATAPPAIKIPFAPPPEPVAVRAPAAPAAPPAIKIPFAPPPEEEADAAEAQTGVEKKFAANDTLGAVLAREGFGSSGPNVIAALAKLVDPRSIRGGQKYVVRAGDDGTPDTFEYQPTPALRYLVERDDDAEGAAHKWTARKLETTIEIKTAEAGGTVESSLYESVQKAGESTALVSLLVELFAWDVNFYIDTHPGDHWKVLIEKQYLGGQFYKYGRVLAAEYGGKVGTFRAFYWAGKDAPRDRPGKYYDEKGQALSKSMLKTPLRFVRISSKFDRKRFHPILHVERAHLGIDYAAPVGTPVWASASGRVVEVGMKRGSGNTIVLAHSNGLSTRYYHLSKYARGLHVGQQVKQKDVIGFVGTTGLSTGPHLHFSVTKNGAFVDPSKLAVNRDAPVAEPRAYLDAIRPRIAALKAMQLGSAVAKN